MSSIDDPRRARRAATGGLIISSALALAGCFDAPRAMMKVTNNTDHDILVLLSGRPQKQIASTDSEDVSLGTSGCIVAGAIEAVTVDNELAAERTIESCDGDTWTIGQGDLVPVDDVASEPSP